MANTNDPKVHLDHLIYRESLRWVDLDVQKEKALFHPAMRFPNLSKLRYRDLDDRQDSTLFSLLRKPDFQRETSAWYPDDCISLLESIINDYVIPSLIVWRSPDNPFLYILDGSHRISVMRAWIIDDWGDKAEEDYYERHEFEDTIRDAARRTRDLIKAKIGSYEDFVKAGKHFLEISRQGGAPKDSLGELEFKRGRFYTELLQDTGFHIQEVSGDYKIAESSFLKINRSGQPLDDWETKLIENRNSSLARSVMSIANRGAGRYWPNESVEPFYSRLVEEITEKSARLHNWLFVPPLQTPIKDANVPFLASTKFFPKHAFLLELLPVIKGNSDVESLFKNDCDSSPDIIIQNGNNLINQTLEIFRHITGASNDPVSMSLVPLFYFYTSAGRFVRSSLYGFISWLMAGSEDDILKRKIIFSSHRGRFEQIFFENDIQGAITRRVGSGLRAIEPTLNFYQQLLELLVNNPGDVSSETFASELKQILNKTTAPRTSKVAKEARKFDVTQKTEINIREIFKSVIRCEICGGILNLRSGVQYDHKIKYSESHQTTIDEGRPTHPFCNNQRDKIESYKFGTSGLKLPPIIEGVFKNKGEVVQLSLFSLFDKTTFPDENISLPE